MSVSPPEGMSEPAWAYLLRFTKAHEGPAYFMYNNYPLKTDKQDVTCGIGFRIENENQAATTFRDLFRVKGSGQIPTETQMRAEFRRVSQINRTATNLFSDYRDKSDLSMDDTATWEFMQTLMKSKFDRQRSHANAEFLKHFADMPAQAQVVLVSYNYGWEIQASPNLCRILNNNYLDFGTARDQILIAKNNPELRAKNIAHQTLMDNAWQIVRRKDLPAALDWNLLPDGYNPPAIIPPEG